MIDPGDSNPLLKSQDERLRQTPPNIESSNEVAPSWMPETLDNSALMKETSKCSETLQECRSGYGKPV
jgi:hypothetical protein